MTQAARGYSVDLSRRAARAVERLGRLLGVEIVGLERLPKRGAMLVANHSFGFWEVAFFIARIRVATGRTVWSLGEHLWWHVPLVCRLARSVGIVDGTPANADALLGDGELVLVLPGGLRESLKPQELRYRLLWGHRYGFVRAAMRTGAPLVPVACFGGDDLFDLTGDAYARGRRFHLPIPLPKLAHLPHRVHLATVIGEPISVENRGRFDDDHAVKSLRREVEGSLHEMLEEELARRAGFAYGR
jgi:1-acyl-sn-glycerol-3-phosphate acyltransferase